MPGYAYVTAKDEQPKRWQYNSEWHELKAGERKAFPLEVAQHAVKYFTCHTGDGTEPETSVEIEPYDGPMELMPVAPAKFADPETGIEYDTMAELLEAVKNRAAAASAKPKG